jgi:hypothetical protein
MALATNAHTVPRFYLSGFASLGSKETPEPFVWVANIASGETKKRAPKNVSLVRGFYDGPGGLEDTTASLEAHLSKIESAAASAIRTFVATPSASGAVVAADVWRFLAWQAARTPGWLDIVRQAVAEWDPNAPEHLIEPPPDGFDRIKDNGRGMLLENPSTGERVTVSGVDDFKAYHRLGWRWVIASSDQLEMVHMQAWYFQTRHFPRLSWTRLTAPEGVPFITSNRGVTWIVDGLADTPPAALRHHAAQVVAPLSQHVALVGRHASQTGPLRVSPREVNRFIASSTSDWIAGPNKEIIELALRDRAEAT